MTLAPLSTQARLYRGVSAFFFAGIMSGAPKAEEIGHDHFHDSHYRHWKQPGTNISCCSDHDCTPVTAELWQGQWFALRKGQWFTPPDWLGTPEWSPLQQGEWIAVPDERILRVPNPTVEGAHLCYSDGRVICFVPPNTGG
jgi:hypothetical protein